ncbi:MAG TPA: N-acetyltransferase [Desulfotomaculum sp.]|nr:N-acetyltransferase [Desulfotomaculum sp.]
MFIKGGNMLTVRKAGKEDIKEMCLLLQELFTLEKDFTPNWHKQRRGLEFILEKPHYGILLLLKKGEEILGMANLLVTVSTATGVKVILLEDFIIKKSARRKGLGKYFFWGGGIKKLAQKEGYSRITLLVDKDNRPAQGFYLSQGFKKSNMDCWRYYLHQS